MKQVNLAFTKLMDFWRKKEGKLIKNDAVGDMTLKDMNLSLKDVDKEDSLRNFLPRKQLDSLNRSNMETSYENHGPEVVDKQLKCKENSRRFEDAIKSERIVQSKSEDNSGKGEIRAIETISKIYESEIHGAKDEETSLGLSKLDTHSFSSEVTAPCYSSIIETFPSLSNVLEQENYSDSKNSSHQGHITQTTCSLETIIPFNNTMPSPDDVDLLSNITTLSTLGHRLEIANHECDVSPTNHLEIINQVESMDDVLKSLPNNYKGEISEVKIVESETKDVTNFRDTDKEMHSENKSVMALENINAIPTTSVEKPDSEDSSYDLETLLPKLDRTDVSLGTHKTREAERLIESNSDVETMPSTFIRDNSYTSKPEEHDKKEPIYILPLRNGIIETNNSAKDTDSNEDLMTSSTDELNPLMFGPLSSAKISAETLYGLSKRNLLTDECRERISETIEVMLEVCKEHDFDVPFSFVRQVIILKKIIKANKLQKSRKERIWMTIKDWMCCCSQGEVDVNYSID